MKKSGKLFNAIILGLVVVIFSLALYGVFKALNYIVEKEKLQSNQIQADLIKKEISTYYTVVPNVYTFKKVTDATYNDSGISGLYKDFAFSSHCDNNLTLKDRNIVQYVTQAPFGELFYRDGVWYLANVSKEFSSKTDVQRYINTCGPMFEKELLEVFQEDQALRKRNLETWK